MKNSMHAGNGMDDEGDDDAAADDDGNDDDDDDDDDEENSSDKYANLHARLNAFTNVRT